MKTQKTETERITETEDRLFNFRPFLFSSVFFILGVVFENLRRAQNLSNWWLCLFVAFVFPLCFCVTWKKFKNVCLGILLLLFAFSLGCNLFSLRLENFQKGGYYEGEYIVFGRVIEVEKREETVFVTLDNVRVDDTQEKGTLFARLPSSYMEIVDIGDELLLMGEVQTDKRVYSDGTIRAYAIEDGMWYTMYAEDCAVTGRSANVFLRIRQKIYEVVHEGMEETPAAVTIAILTGNTDGIGEGLLENIRYGGIAHIFAVSGLHVGALYGFCMQIIKKGKLYRINPVFRFLFVAFLLLFYGGICGFSPSVVRAITMCLVLYASKLIGTGEDISERIGLACIIVLIRSPVSLYTVGFQLSFSACLGIALLSTPIQNAGFKTFRVYERTLDKPFTFKQSVCRNAISFFAVTLSAQLATLPFLYDAFGYVSCWGLLLNCIFVPLLSVGFSFLLLGVFLACLCPWLANAILYAPNLLLSAVLLLFETVDFSTFAITNITITGGCLCLYYLALLFITDKCNIGKTWRRALSMTFSVLCLGVFLMSNL
ncbi:MAG: ComEC family competence protein [Clostridiales bacterium]|nr:ComEC family competence protein [Clostridiales bacterium]